MIVGSPKEIKDNERRVGLTPKAAQAYAAAGHKVLIEKGAGLGAGFSDERYLAAGAEMSPDGPSVWAQAEMVVKVKEPLAAEWPLMRPGQIVFTFFHLAASLELTLACLDRRVAAVAYETVAAGGELPLLKPMSAVAGRMASLVGAYFLASPFGGSGVLPTGLTGVEPAKALILGGGTVGQNAAIVAAGLGCRVAVLDVDPAKLAYLKTALPPGIERQISDGANLEAALADSDIVVGAVLVPGAKTPKVVSRERLKLMKPGSVVVDVAIDQGGCFETSRMTTHSQPVYVEEGVVHYCVGNMPGAYAQTSTLALNEVTLPYGLELANKGVRGALKENPALKGGLNAYEGLLALKPVAEALGLMAKYRDNVLE
ncbi:MAG: alanine dehydrogenase [Deltaproteobacteria bacterium]|jgi:alanine dehydrogenase|nr:alanine dehydrogenase [Deltaproteobacteria bacterium]